MRTLPSSRISSDRFTSSVPVRASLVILLLCSAAETSSAQTIAATGSMNTRRADHTLTALADGRVLAAGGWVADETTDTAEIYNPVTGAGL